MVLQWGRVLMNAETPPYNVEGQLLPKLQWGRVLMNAETDGDFWLPGLPGSASMGPRSHERGNQSLVPNRVRKCSRFNGAAFS